MQNVVLLYKSRRATYIHLLSFEAANYTHKPQKEDFSVVSLHPFSETRRAVYNTEKTKYKNH